MCERGSAGICCHDSPDAEAIDPPVRAFHTVSPRTWVNKLALGRSGRLSNRARDRDHSDPLSPWATLSPWSPGRRSEASESVEARR